VIYRLGRKGVWFVFHHGVPAISKQTKEKEKGAKKYLAERKLK
jgi:hypothetical protein